MNKIILTIVALLGLGSVLAVAQEEDSKAINPTLVFGAAATQDGGQNVFMVEQPADAPNPLGDPLVVNSDNVQSQEEIINTKETQQNSATVKTSEVADKAVADATAEELGKDFQNTLVEANGRVYDVQSYPEQDLKVMGNPSDPQTIYSPNVNN